MLFPYNDKEYMTAVEDLRNTCSQYIKKNDELSDESQFALSNITQPDIFVNFVAANLPFSVEDKMQLLMTTSYKERVFLLLKILNRDIQLLTLKENIRSKTREDIDGVFSTGYGRAAVGSSSREVTEISCHAKGARYFNPKVCTILDIGGQDSKAIRLTKDGGIADFVMNDKCAAGTGRFLEAMARTLEVSVDELGDISAKSQKDVEISSMCTVFAESEVISLIAQNTEKADIARGVHRAIAGKAVSLMKRVRPEPAYMMTGGVARNKGVVREIEKLLGEPVYICEEPDIVGAAGAALYALDELE